uniref:Uncharacterized protein n=1 Tax=viral metagenome TaxID=1070528 RepID=A0A6M3JNY7_9ZZZZ
MTGKYDSLKEVEVEVIEGTVLTDSITTYHWIGHRLVVMRGFPPCPECEDYIYKDWDRDRWVCYSCHTAWTTGELIEGLENNRITNPEE